MKQIKKNIYFEIDFVKILKREKLTIIFLPLLFAITGFIYSSTLLKKYETSIKLNPPKLFTFRDTNYYFKIGEDFDDFIKIQKDFLVSV